MEAPTPNPIQAYLSVAIGGAMGSIIRFAIAQAIHRLNPDHPYLAVASVNITGSFLIGLLAGHFTDRTQPLYLFAAVGILGGFTTFSSLSLDLLAHFQKGQATHAIINAILQITLGLIAAAIGFNLTTR